MYKNIHNPCLLLLALTWPGCPVAAADADVALPAKRREMTTDRPDATESPYTIDPGHMQLEMDFASQSRNQQDGDRTVEWEAAPFNLRVGLTSRSELGVFVVPYHRTRETDAAGSTRTHAGAGDLTLRGKWNFFGNDGGAALGLITDLKLPTAAPGLGNGAVEGAVFLPVNFAAGHGWEIGAMTGVDLRLRASGHGRRGVWINSVTTGHDVVGSLAGYLELTSETGDGSQVATFDVGLTYQVDANTQLDIGAEIGLSRAAPDLRVFTGISRRF